MLIWFLEIQCYHGTEREAEEGLERAGIGKRGGRRGEESDQGMEEEVTMAKEQTPSSAWFNLLI